MWILRLCAVAEHRDASVGVMALTDAGGWAQRLGYMHPLRAIVALA